MDYNLYRQERKQLVASLKQCIRPLLHATGYVTRPTLAQADPQRFLQAWVPTDIRGKRTEKAYRLNGFVLTQFDGFTANGVITDATAGGLATVEFDSLPLEDLFKLVSWAKRFLPAHLAVRQAVKRQSKQQAKQLTSSTYAAGA